MMIRDGGKKSRGNQNTYTEEQEGGRQAAASAKGQGRITEVEGKTARPAGDPRGQSSPGCS